MMVTMHSGKTSFAGLAVALAAAIATGCTGGDQSPASGPGAVAPGTHARPPGIHAIAGECTGRIALAPFPLRPGDGQPYPAIYDCATKQFEVPRLTHQAGFTALGDLTLTRDGYYLHQSRSTDFVRHGGYYFYDREGRRVRSLTRSDMNVHDVIPREGDITYLKYVPDRDAARCGATVPLEVEIVTEDLAGRVLWTWTSKGRFDVSQKVATEESTVFQPEEGWRKWFRPVRNCYTALARRLVKFDTPQWFVQSGRFPLLQVDHVNYVQANSIEWIEPAGDILVSARFLDTVFLIDRKSGAVKWSLGGRHAKAAMHFPEGDPKGGFSHQHAARIAGNRLWIFDNGNLFRDRPSRAVAYQLDSAPPNRLVFEFTEPNGRQRGDLGYVQALEDDRLLIGWGGVRPGDRRKPQRAVSIVEISTGREVFSIDFSPGWVSYRAKASQP